jgi:hypothetical protein
MPGIFPPDTAMNFFPGAFLLFSILSHVYLSSHLQEAGG